MFCCAGPTPEKGGDRKSLVLQHSPDKGSGRPMANPTACQIEESRVSAGAAPCSGTSASSQGQLGLVLQAVGSRQPLRESRTAPLPGCTLPDCSCSAFVSLNKAKPHSSFRPGTKERPTPLWRWWFTWPQSVCLWTADTSSGWRGMEPSRTCGATLLGVTHFSLPSPSLFQVLPTLLHLPKPSLGFLWSLNSGSIQCSSSEEIPPLGGAVSHSLHPPHPVREQTLPFC